MSPTGCPDCRGHRIVTEWLKVLDTFADLNAALYSLAVNDGRDGLWRSVDNWEGKYALAIAY